MVRKGFLVSWFPITALAAICFTPTSPAWAQFVGPPPTTVLGVECSRVPELGMDKMMNVRAHLILMGCGLEEPAHPATTPPGGGPKKLQPIGSPINLDTITGTETYPKVTQSESMVWSSDSTTIVVNYNDSTSSPSNYSGVSVSIDGGATFIRLLPAPFATGHGTNYGDPTLGWAAERCDHVKRRIALTDGSSFNCSLRSYISTPRRYEARSLPIARAGRATNKRKKSANESHALTT